MSSSIAGKLDCAILRPEADDTQFELALGEALRHPFAAVCVHGCHVERAAALLAGSPVRLCAVVGYPFGASQPGALAHEAAELVRAGAAEVEFVGPLRFFLSQAMDKAAEVMRQLVDQVRSVRADVTVKAVIEAAALMRDATADAGESRVGAACDAARRAGCDYVISATGQHPAGVTTAAAVRLMRKHAAGLSVKAAGGVRTWADARAMFDAGADRVGSSLAVAILKAKQSSSGVQA